MREDVATVASPGATVGATIGVEEEYHLVAPDGFGLLNRPALAALADRGGAGTHLHPEMLTSQLEAATAVCTELGELRRAVVQVRREAAAAAADVGALILATSTHPFSSLGEIALMDRPRYDRLVERFGSVVRQFNLCGCHVHVGVPDLDTAVAIMAHARSYLPVLAALTASSPFHAGIDTGYESFRLSQLALWPQGGSPPHLRDAADYRSTVDQLTALGLIDDATMLLWELRPSARYPTLEFRIGDVCTDVDDAVLFAGVVRSLVRTLGARVARGAPVPGIADTVLRAARWRAARYGLGGALWSPGRARLVPGHVVIGDLWTELEPDLVAHGEHDLLRPLLDDLLRRGTSATRQREVFAAADCGEVARDAVELTARA